MSHTATTKITDTRKRNKIDGTMYAMLLMAADLRCQKGQKQ